MTVPRAGHRFRKSVPILVMVGLLLVAVGLGWKLRKGRRAFVPASDAESSLLFLTDLNGGEEAASRQRLVRVGTRDGELLPTEIVWEGEANFFGHDYRIKHQLVDERYVVTATGGVIDVWTKSQIHDRNSELVDVTGGRVISLRRRPANQRTVHAFDLQSHWVERLTGLDEEKYGLPGTRSPDDLKSVDVVGCALTLHRFGLQPRPLGGDFLVEQSPNSSHAGEPPVLWLDGAQFLTQLGNGNLVTVDLDGRRTLRVTIPTDRDLFQAPQLYRDGDGRIVYLCGKEGFSIDSTNWTWTRSTWAALGFGFEASWWPDGAGRHSIRYRGAAIGQWLCWPPWWRRTAVAEGRLAVMVDEGKENVRIWSATTREWTTLEVRPSCLIGWMKSPPSSE